MTCVNVDFSLALHNRTGKYFIGRDLLDTPDLPLGDVYYWRLPLSRPPSAVAAKIIGRLQHWQIRALTLGGPLRIMPRHRPRAPMLHLDPWTVPTIPLRATDAVLCHDIGPVTHPYLFDLEVGAIYRQIYSEIERVGPHLIFVSNASRRAFEECYPAADRTRMRVIYPAIRSGISVKAANTVAGIDGPFLLTVGSIGDRKNQVRCIEAFAKSGLARHGLRYVICGAREPGADAVIAAAEQTHGVICLPYIDDSELSWLYGNARGFVLASLLEGFGMPVAEAIARGVVPLVSRHSVLDEVAGESALCANPADPASIAAGMTALATLTEGDRAARLVNLRASIARFDIERIRAAWRTAFADIVANRPAKADSKLGENG